MRKFLLLIFLLVTFMQAQVITWDPLYITVDDSVTVYFNAAEGNKGLMNYSNTGSVYAHAGVLTTASTNPGDWKHAPAWGDNSTKYHLTYMGNNIYKFVVHPDIKSFYQINTGEVVTNLAFVFRSGDQSKVGKDIGDADIFLPLHYGVSFLSPTENVLFKNFGESISIKGIKADFIDSLVLTDNNIRISSTINDTLNSEILVNEGFNHRVRLLGYVNGTVAASDSFDYFFNPMVTEAPLPEGVREGINYISDTEVTLVLFAPKKDFVYVIGDFNDWTLNENYLMNRTPNDSTYWITLDGLTPGMEYGFQYSVNGYLKIADPYAEKTLDPWNDIYIPSENYPALKSYPEGKTTEIVSVFQTAQPQYNWEASNYVKPAKEKIVIYEMWLRNFLEDFNYQTLADTLSYLQNLGINAIELMPNNEFEGNESWGYNPSFYLALDKYYGNKDNYKKFIDECHKRNIAVIMDLVLNHNYNQSSLVRLYFANGNPTADNPYFNVKAPHTDFSWGNDFNHQSVKTQQFVDRVTSYWMNEYKIDGFRFDFTGGFTQKSSSGGYDLDRINVLKRMADKMWEVDSTAYVILEHWTDDSEKRLLADYGLMVWGDAKRQYQEAAMGWHESGKSNLAEISYKYKSFTKPGLVGYMESHDEERIMVKCSSYGNSSGTYNIKETKTALDRMAACSAFFFTVPGPKMMWMFQELGFDVSIDFNGRLGLKPFVWNDTYYGNADRQNLYKVNKALLWLRNNNEVFNTSNYTMNTMNSVKTMKLSHPSMNAVVIANFDVTEKPAVPGFQNNGIWYDYFSGDSLNVTDMNMSISLAPGEYHIYTTKRQPKPDADVYNDADDDNTSTPAEYSLNQNFPNPFNPETTIKFSMPSAGFVSLKVYNILGQEIRTLVSSDFKAGNHSVRWNGKDNSGNSVASGIYLYRLDCGNFIKTNKMIMLK